MPEFMHGKNCDFFILDLGFRPCAVSKHPRWEGERLAILTGHAYANKAQGPETGALSDDHRTTSKTTSLHAHHSHTK